MEVFQHGTAQGGSQDRVAAFKLRGKKTPVVTGDHISLMFDLQLLISPFQLAFVKLFVVLGVY